MTNDEARVIITFLLDKQVPNPGPTWEKVVDLCLWAKTGMAEGRFRDRRGIKRDRRAYMRFYMQKKRSKQKGPSSAIDGTQVQN